MDARYPILQSGFVAFDTKMLTEPSLSSDPYNDLVINGDHRKNNNPYFYSADIHRVFTDHIQNPSFMSDFDFRENVLKLAIWNFRNFNFIKWLELQKKYGMLSQMHVMFLDETLRFLLGKDRTVRPSQYLLMCEAKRGTVVQPFEYKEYFFEKEFGYRKDTTIQETLPEDMVDIIQYWVSRPNGYEDLLVSCEVIFGPRFGIRDVAEKGS